MFGKKSCANCSKKIKKDFEFCPYCGIKQKNNSDKDYGLLGLSDEKESLSPGYTQKPGIFDKMIANLMGAAFNQAVKMMEKEINSEKNKQSLNNLGGFELYINGKKINLPENLGIKNVQMPIAVKKENNSLKTNALKVPEETLQKSTKLPRKQAKSKVSRTSNSIIYELETPGISSLENILINKLESSFEIKIFTEKTVYIKTLPIKQPLLKYSINPKEGRTILEFRA